MYQQLAKGDAGNLVFSPVSISNAISMLEAGAHGETLQQIDATLRFSLGKTRTQDAFNALDQMLATPRHAADGETGTPLTLEQTDALWGQRGYSFEHGYLDLLAHDYGAGLRLADFAKDAETERVKINSYVASATHGKINELFPKGVIDAMTRIVLVNAITFKGDWVTPFSASPLTAAFTRLDGSTESIPMMQDGTASHALLHASFPNAPKDDHDFEAVELPYVGGASMVIIEPDPGKFVAVEREFGPGLIDDVERASNLVDYEVSMPKFDFSSQFSLNDTLSAMGMPDVFKANTADLSGIDGTMNLYVSAVEHQASIKVDEKGTEAVAATGIVGGVTDAPPVDHGRPPVPVRHPRRQDRRHPLHRSRPRSDRPVVREGRTLCQQRETRVGVYGLRSAWSFSSGSWSCRSPTARGPRSSCSRRRR